MNAFPAPMKGDAGHSALAHVAARLGGPVSRQLIATAGYEAEVAATSCTAIFGEWQRSSASTFAYSLASCGMMIAVDDGLAGAVLEQQFGGSQIVSSRKNSGHCRATASLARHIAGGVANAIADAWPGGKLTDIVALPETTRFARADDNVATITLGLSHGEIRIAFAVEGIARISGVPLPPRITDWSAQLRISSLSARLPVRAILARPQFPAATVRRLSVGDVLPIPKPVSVPLYAGAHRLATGILTETDGQTALQIQTMETIPND